MIDCPGNRTRPACETTDLGVLPDGHIPILSRDTHRHRVVVDELLRRACLDDAPYVLTVTTVMYQKIVDVALAGLRCARQGEQSWIVPITEVAFWLPLDFSLSKASDSTATGQGCLFPHRHKTLLPTEQAPPSGAETARLSRSTTLTWREPTRPGDGVDASGLPSIDSCLMMSQQGSRLSIRVHQLCFSLHPQGVRHA